MATETVDSLVSVARDVMMRHYNQLDTGETYAAYVDEIQTRCSGEYICYDLRIHFPYIVCDAERLNFLLEEVKNNHMSLRNRGIDEFLDIAVASLVFDYFDEPIPLTGSTGICNDTAIYKFVGVYSSTEEVMAQTPHEILEPGDAIIFSDNDIGERMTPIMMMPIISSMSYANYQEGNEIEVGSLDSHLHNAHVGKTDQRYKYSINNFMRGELVHDFDTFGNAKFFISLWSPLRFLDYYDWRNAGEAMFDSSRGSDGAKKIWTDLTLHAHGQPGIKAAAPFNTNLTALCDKQWRTFRFDRVDVRELAWIARLDSFDAYRTWHDEWSCAADVLAISLLDADVALSVHRRYWLDYMSTFSGTRQVWYRFSGHHMRLDENAHHLRQLLSGDYLVHLRLVLNDITFENTTGSPTDPQKEKADTVSQAITNLIVQLKKHRFKNTVIAELADIMFTERLERRLDLNPNLFGVANGVIVAHNYGVKFRDGRPTDFITKVSDTSYDPNMTADDKAVINTKLWMDQALKYDAELVKYFWLHQSALICGGNPDKKIFCYAGEQPHGGKSSIVKIMEHVFGCKLAKVPPSKLTCKNDNPEGPTPVLAGLIGTYAAIVDEPPRGKPMNTDFVKRMTSDSFWQRGHYSMGFKVDIYHTMIVVTNFAPEFDEKGNAIRARWVIIPFDSMWDETAPDDPEEQKKKSHYKESATFEEDLKYLAQAWLWLCVHNYPEYLRTRLRKLPEAVRKVTNRYWAEKDLYFTYIQANTKDCTEEEKGLPGKSVTLVALYESFVGWYVGFKPNKPIPDQIEFNCEMSQRWRRMDPDTLGWNDHYLTQPASEGTVFI
jgi:phage/plasmid-associated DNA primase